MNDGLFAYKHVCMLLVSLGHWCYQVEDEAMPVPPMLLITFVENAFKYGVSTFSPSFIIDSFDETSLIASKASHRWR